MWTQNRWRLVLSLCLCGVGIYALADDTTTPSNSKNTGSSAHGTATGASEHDLVKKLHKSRKDYLNSLESLYHHYSQDNDHKDNEKAKWIQEELLQYHRTVKHPYILELDVPPAILEPKENIAKANDLFRRAMSYKDRGYGSEYVDNQRRTEKLLQEILEHYPQSDKISDVAYQLGELYEKYRPNPQYRRAALYYERSFQWNKASHTDARLRAAKLYDKMINDKPKAIEMYKSVISHDTDNNRVSESQKRLGELMSRR